MDLEARLIAESVVGLELKIPNRRFRHEFIHTFFGGHYPSCFTVMIADLELGIADELLIAIRSALCVVWVEGLLEFSRILTHMHRRTPPVGHLHNKLL